MVVARAPRRRWKFRTRRTLLIAGLLLAMGPAACAPSIQKTESSTPRLDGAGLDRAVGRVAERARPGMLGVALMNLESGEFWTFNGDRPFPMANIFEAPLGAAVLAEVDAGRLSLDETIHIGEHDLSPPPSAIADAWPGRTDYTVRELLAASVGGADNTAADVLMRRIGGPGAVTAWLRLKNINEVRVDRYARELLTDRAGMASFRLAWKGERAFAAAMATVPPATRHAAMDAYLRDPRDTATPRSFLHFLMELEDRSLLSGPSTALLLRLLGDADGDGRVSTALPPDVTFAHRSGAAPRDLGITPAANDVGVLTFPPKRHYALAVFLSGSTLDAAGRDALIADVGRAVVRGVR